MRQQKSSVGQNVRQIGSFAGQNKCLMPVLFQGLTRENNKRGQLFAKSVV